MWGHRVFYWLSYLAAFLVGWWVMEIILSLTAAAWAQTLPPTVPLEGSDPWISFLASLGGTSGGAAWMFWYFRGELREARATAAGEKKTFEERIQSLRDQLAVEHALRIEDRERMTREVAALIVRAEKASGDQENRFSALVARQENYLELLIEAIRSLPQSQERRDWERDTPDNPGPGPRRKP